jgi:hypothetical protein
MSHFELVDRAVQGSSRDRVQRWAPLARALLQLAVVVTHLAACDSPKASPEPLARQPAASPPSPPTSPSAVEPDRLVVGFGVRERAAPPEELESGIHFFTTLRLCARPGESRDLTTYPQRCNALDEPVPGALATIRCWWAGSGKDVSLVRDGSDVVVTETHVESEVDDIFPAEEIARLPVRPGAAVVVEPCP